MSSRIAVLTIDAVNPRVIADFWREVLDWREVDADDYGITIAASPQEPTIDVLTVPEGKNVKNRLHLDLRADGTSTAEELQRLLVLGAVHVDVGQSPQNSWVVLADPDGKRPSGKNVVRHLSFLPAAFLRSDRAGNRWGKDRAGDVPAIL